MPNLDGDRVPDIGNRLVLNQVEDVAGLTVH